MTIQRGLCNIRHRLRGRLLAELPHCWNLRESPQLPAYSRSPFYWGIKAAVILAGRLIAWIYLGDSAEAITAVHIDVSIPLILRSW
jgi:hypothetical protein